MKVDGTYDERLKMVLDDTCVTSPTSFQYGSLLSVR